MKVIRAAVLKRRRPRLQPLCDKGGASSLQSFPALLAARSFLVLVLIPH